jgi:hypothetical protein
MKTEKQQTAVEWFFNALIENQDKTHKQIELIFEQAKAMESKERLKYLLLIGKITEILGFDKTVELLKECNNEII